MIQPIFDSQHFLQSLAGDEDLARELLAAFMEDSPERSSSLREALDSEDAGRASKLAHSLKGMCGVVRTGPLVDLAYLMENTAKKGDLGKVKKQYESFMKLLEAAYSEMNQFMKNN